MWNDPSHTGARRRSRAAAFNTEVAPKRASQFGEGSGSGGWCRGCSGPARRQLRIGGVRVRRSSQSDCGGEPHLAEHLEAFDGAGIGRAAHLAVAVLAVVAFGLVLRGALCRGRRLVAVAHVRRRARQKFARCRRKRSASRRERNGERDDYGQNPAGHGQVRQSSKRPILNPTLGPSRHKSVMRRLDVSLFDKH